MERYEGFMKGVAQKDQGPALTASVSGSRFQVSGFLIKVAFLEPENLEPGTWNLEPWVYA